MDIRRGLMAQMTTASKDTAIINDKTKHLRMTVYGSKALNRLFSHSNIETIYMDGITNLNAQYFFEFMNSLKAAVFPDATATTAYLFWNTNQNVPVPGIDFYKKIAFSSATSFRLEAGADIILRSNEMCTTGFTAATWGMSSGIKFYVPESLLSAYRSDANWSTFGESRILPIEGSKYENIDWWKSL